MCNVEGQISTLNGISNNCKKFESSIYVYVSQYINVIL